MLETVSNQISVTADRIVLRPPQKSDTGLLTLYLSDQKIAQGLRNVPHPLPPGTVEALIARGQHPERTSDIWVMDGTASGHAEVLGLITLTRMDRAQSEVSYWVVPAFWNVGFATEAVTVFLERQKGRCFVMGLRTCSRRMQQRLQGASWLLR